LLSARAFVLLWASLTALVIGYAFLDLWLSPALWTERSFSMEPDLSQIWEVRHWGGRLLRERAWGLLVCNALVLGGLSALLLHGAVRWLLQRGSAPSSNRTSFAGESASIPPPA
jgi:hypothetical protein